jgi:hypothetical protein
LLKKAKDDNIRHLREVFLRLQGAVYILNPAKSMLGIKEISSLERLLSVTVIHVNHESIREIQNVFLCRKYKVDYAFLRMAALYCSFVLNFSIISKPLNTFKWKNLPLL